MSAVSKSVTPASSAASTTDLVAAASIRPPKLLQPRPTTDASRPAMERVCIDPAWPSPGPTPKPGLNDPRERQLGAEPGRSRLALARRAVHLVGVEYRQDVLGERLDRLECQLAFHRR